MAFSLCVFLRIKSDGTVAIAKQTDAGYHGSLHLFVVCSVCFSVRLLSEETVVGLFLRLNVRG